MRICFVVNPRAGEVRCQDLTAAIGREFAGHQIAISSRPPVLPVRDPLRIEDLLWPQKRPEEPEMVAAVGGDGTVNRVVNAVAGRNIPVGIIPCGSSNDLAGALSIPDDFHMACQVIKAARLTDIDLVSVNGKYFATCGGLGMASHVAFRANRWRHGRTQSSRWVRALGPIVYPLALLRELCGSWRPLVARIISGDEDRADNWLSVLISNQPRFGGFSTSPQADNRDGLLDLCRIRAPSRRLRALWISLLTYKGRSGTSREVSQHRVREATIVSQDAVMFFGDGEILDQGQLFRVRVQPRAIWVATPRGKKTWLWWKHHQEQREQLLRYYLRRPSCRPMTISAPAVDTASSDFSGCPLSR